MRGRAEGGDGDLFPFDRFRRVDLGTHQNAMNALIVLRRDHNKIGPPERRSDHGAATGRSELNVSGVKRIDASRRPTADKDRLDF